ncbi:Fe-S protein assembly co-chaperone HscB [Comamonadaceae bacterium G21597-S1]|nr:Fe-S protein assembly co-chaperone HscB [Comamonadaceae bacterium G21597-S1]
MTLSASDFELFGVPQRFAQNRNTLDARWKQLQREAHPDRFAAQDAATQRRAMQWSVRINEAYQRLKDPLKRAAYLCELAGAPINAHDNTAMPTEFLMQQMAWREALDEARDTDQVQALLDEVMLSRQQALVRCEQLLDEAGDAGQAVGVVRALMFIERFSADIDDRFETLQSQAVAPAPGPAVADGG